MQPCRIRSLLGETESATSAEEIAWAFRKLIEQQAQERPLVCVFDDLHWAEETLLDLVEHVADLSRDAPVLLLCMARPELLEKRPAWGGGKWNATTVLLEPLDAVETERLLDALGGVEPGLRERIADGRRRKPALPGGDARARARLGRMPRSACRRPSRRSWRLVSTSSTRPSAPSSSAARSRATSSTRAPCRPSPTASRRRRRLVALVRKQLVRPDTPQFAGEEAYRFRHLLIRDAAYDALAQRRPRRPARTFRRTGSSSEAPTWSSWTRSSATISSRQRAISPSSSKRIQRSPNERLNASRPQDGARLAAAMTAPRRRCSSARSRSLGPSNSTCISRSTWPTRLDPTRVGLHGSLTTLPNEPRPQSTAKGRPRARRLCQVSTGVRGHGGRARRARARGTASARAGE